MSAAEFRRGIESWVESVETDSHAVFVAVATEVHRSVTVGSPVTGAPGQPVQRGTLRDSWIPEFTSRWTFQTTTNLPYALPIELGIGPFGPLTLRSQVGGFHSVARTRVGFPSIIAFVMAQPRSRSPGGTESGAR